MKKILLIIVFVCCSIILFSQNYSTNFRSDKEIRSYLTANIDKLDPIEGEYDVKDIKRTGSPYWPYGELNYISWIVRNPNTGLIELYSLYQNDFFKSKSIKIQQIGNTNVYDVWWKASKGGGKLENKSFFSCSVNLTKEDGRDLLQNRQFAHWVSIELLYQKRYPTNEMYAEAAKRIIEETKPEKWTGTGFAIGNEYIVTNYHVIEDAKSINIQGIKGLFNYSYTATVVAKDKNTDLAILKINDSTFDGFGSIAYGIKTSTSEVGEDVFVLGYPLTATMGDEIKLTTGVISSKTGFQGDVSMYQFSAPVQPGSSGGPLFDTKGNIIGIVTAKHLGAENAGYAIKTSYLKNLIETLSEVSFSSNNTISNLSLVEKVKKVKSCVFLIICK